MTMIMRAGLVVPTPFFLSLLLLGEGTVKNVVFAQQHQQQQDFIVRKQKLGNPYEGQYTGIAWADLNNDGSTDLLISAGKHWIDQSYALINLGTTAENEVRFSEPLPLGPPGGYYNVDAGDFSSLPTGHHGVLLAGGSCHQLKRNQFGKCRKNQRTPAVLLDVIVTGCSAQDPRAPCHTSWEEVWRDDSIEGHKGHRNGALSYELGGGGDPAIVFVGGAGISVFEPPFRDPGSRPAFAVLFDEDLAERWDDGRNRRASGLAVGTLGAAYPGFFVGIRTEAMARPAPLVGVWRNEGGRAAYEWDLTDLNNEYRADARDLAVQTSGLVLADLDGDGIADLVESNLVMPRFAGAFVQQDYFLLNAQGFPKKGMPRTFSWERGTGARSVAVGDLFRDGAGPDLALGLGHGEVALFANLGHDDAAAFRGFGERGRVPVMPGCEVRDVKIVPGLLDPDGAGGSAAVVCVVFCKPEMQHVPTAQGGVFVLHVQ